MVKPIIYPSLHLNAGELAGWCIVVHNLHILTRSQPFQNDLQDAAWFLDRYSGKTLDNHYIHIYKMNMVKCGQELGVIRTDMSEHLIFAWLQARDDAGDH